MENRIVNWANWNKVRYTIYAPFYDAVEKFVGKGRRQAIRLVAPKPGENILIVGCGTGLDLDYMSPSYTTIRP